MATTTVKAGSGRAAATERRNRHAQRTPLPPKPGQIEAAREPVSDPSAKSWGKADTFKKEALRLGWETELKAVDTTVTLLASRGTSEFLHQAWDNGVWQYEASTYTYEDRTLKPRNASGALKLIARSPEDAGEEMAKVAANKQFKRREPGEGEIKRFKLPFDPALDPDEVVMTAVRGQAISWFNRLTNKPESAIVGRGNSMHITVSESGRRILNFCCPATGYRSMYVDAILKVGRGKSLTRGESNSRGGAQEVTVE